MTDPMRNGQQDSVSRRKVRHSAAVLFAALALCAVMNAQQTDRAKQIGKRLMCVCGCNQVLTECNHIGCTYSHGMLQEVDERVAKGESDDLTLQSFVQEYGATVLLLPAAKGFNRWMWIMPIVLPLLGLILAWQAIARWRRRGAVSAGTPISPEMLARAERESHAGGDI